MPMKQILKKLTVPLWILFVINCIGFIYYKNFEGAVVGSIVGMIVAFLALEIKAKFD